MENLKYPVGRFKAPNEINSDDINTWIQIIADFPSLVAIEVAELTYDDLEATYREGGWNIRQIVHHVVDSHMNSYIRFKLALTEDNPIIKPYDEAAWADLPDTYETPLEVTLQLLSALHEQWIVLLYALTEEDLERTYRHPAKKNDVSLGENVALYAWHCEHHLEHIRLAKKG